MDTANKKVPAASGVALMLLFLCFSAMPRIMITELQRDPAGAESSSPGGASHEFVELTNFGIDTVTLDSLCLTDGVEADTVVPWPSALPMHPGGVTGSLLLPPGLSALILDRDYMSAVDSVPSSLLSLRDGTVLITVGDADLGSGLAADDGLVIYKGTRTLMRRVVCFAADSAAGGSDPRAGKISLSGPAGAPEGFSAVPVSFLFDTAVTYGICGDSLTPGYFELLKNGWFAEWRFGPLDTIRRTFACSLSCVKSGVLPAGPVGWRIVYQSASQTVTAAEGTCALSGNHASALFVCPLDSHPCFLRLTEGDTETVWPLDLSQLWLPVSPVKISELFPRANAGEPEWIELVNVSPMPINLRNWTFGNSESRDTVIARDCVLEPGRYLVLAADLAFFRVRYPAQQDACEPLHWHTLDNYNDTLCLWDAKRNLKERVCWESGWFSGWTTQSLERVSLSNSGMDAASWALAASPTPGQPNGAALWRAGEQPRLDAGPLPFSPDGDGRNDLLSIIIDLPAAYTAAVSIYGFSGKKLRTFSGPLSHRIEWDGRCDNGSPAPSGPFFVVMESKSPEGTIIVRKKGVLWR
ncbi:MAG: lamin tail domain-containing protein [Chitinispirillaceae bacterium]|nr:lamin tail domain-containing protein [Chitinispirillaceae bacterium]